MPNSRTSSRVTALHEKCSPDPPLLGECKTKYTFAQRPLSSFDYAPAHVFGGMMTCLTFLSRKKGKLLVYENENTAVGSIIFWEGVTNRRWEQLSWHRERSSRGALCSSQQDFSLVSGGGGVKIYEMRIMDPWSDRLLEAC